jgi:hypothetical protein
MLELLKAFGQVPEGDDGEELARAVATILPAMFAITWMLMTGASGMLAQGIAVRLGRNRRPTPKLAEIELPNWIAFALAGAAVGSLLPGTAGFIGKSLLVILAFPFFFQGLALVHASAARASMPRLILTAFYALLLLFVGTAVVVAALGLFEQWARLRRRLAGPGPGQEDE